jgi:hypothetical protein
MNRDRQIKKRALLIVAVVLTLTTASRLMRADTGSCGGAMLTLPFNDVPANNGFFCAIAEAFFTGLSNGTSATTYNPSGTVPREQMAAFITRTLDQSLKRGNRRAALGQWWTPTSTGSLRGVAFGSIPRSVVCDGTDLWVTVPNADAVVRIEASSGRIEQTWTGFAPATPSSIIAAAGVIFVVAQNGISPGRIYVILPEVTAGGFAILVENSIGSLPGDVTFDGTNLWTSNTGSGIPGTGGISRIRSSDALDTSFSLGFVAPVSILWDGAALWVLDPGLNPGEDALKEVNPSTGEVISIIPLTDRPTDMIFDGTNLWISSFNAGEITIVRAVGALKGTVLQTITGNGLNGCAGMAFDGERVLVVNRTGNSVSMFKAADFTPLGSLSTGGASDPRAVCSDGVNFWIVRAGSNDIVRF